MKSIRHQISIIAILLGTFLFSQEHSINGIVIDINGLPLELASVFIYQEDGKTLVSGTTTEHNGVFRATLPAGGGYVLIASYLEKRSMDHPFTLSGDLNLGTITIDTSNELDEVAVIAERPKFERKMDRYVFTVQNTSLVQGNITDVLARTPGLIVINDQLNYKGEGGIGIMVNDKLINLPNQNVWDMLKGMSAGTVKSIEVITNPPVKYNVEGGVLINIIMEGNLTFGYNGSINTNYTQGRFPKHILGVDQFFKTKKTALALNYGYSNRKGTKRFVDNINFFEGATTSNWNADQNRILNTIGHNANVFFDWKFNDQTTLSVTSFNLANPRKDQDVSTDTQITGEVDRAFRDFISANHVLQKDFSSSTYLDIDHKFPSNNGSLSGAAHFTYFETEQQQEVTNDFFDADGIRVEEIDFNTFSNQQIRLVTAQMDYDSKAGKKGRLAMGIKFAGIDSNNTLFQNGTEVLANSISGAEGSFDYDEQIYSTYGSLDFSWKRTDLTFGLRTEYTESRGNLLDSDEVFQNNYLKLFPNLSFKHNLKKERSLILYYYRRITRPRYEEINPFQMFESYNSTVEGNPKLQPATRHYVAAGYNFKEWIGFELFYRHRKNQLRRLSFQDNTENRIRHINSNVHKERACGIDVLANKKVASFWQTNLITSYYYYDNKFKDLESGVFESTSGWVYDITNNNSFSFLPKRGLTMDLDILYRSPRAEGNYRIEALGSINFSVKKQLWNGNGSVGAGITDIFSQTDVMVQSRFLNQDNTSFLHPETPLVNINFRYRFGNTAITSNKKRKRQDDVDRI